MRLEWFRGHDAIIGEYLTAHFPELAQLGKYEPHFSVGFIDKNNMLRGALGMKLLNPWDGTLSIFVEPGYFPTPNMLRFLFRRVFKQAGLKRLTCHIWKGNKRARRLVEGLGFELEGVKPRGFDGHRAACIYGMTAEHCKWLERSSGR